VKYIWNNPYLNCGCRWKCRMIIAVEALIFLRLLSNCLNWKIYCDDHSSLSSTTAVQIWIISYILHNLDYVKIIIDSSKTDLYRDGSSVLLARAGTVTCPYTILSRYFHLAALNCNSSDFVFCIFHKSTLSYSLGSRPISYTRARELLLNSLVELGFPKSSYGLPATSTR